MDIREIVKNKNVQTAVLSWTVGLVGGMSIGYVVGARITKRKQLRIVIDETVKEIHEDLDRMRAARGRTQTAEEMIDEEAELEARNAVKEADMIEEMDRLKAEEREQEVPSEPEDAPVLVNVFSDHDDVWDMEAELSTRDPNVPYVIHQEEFIGDEMDFHQETLTYYAGDDVMADTDDTPVYNYRGLMGELLFGHGTNDKNVVYIRNEKLHIEWEILRHDTMFSQEVLGLEMEREADDELKHSHAIPKFRRE